MAEVEVEPFENIELYNLMTGTVGVKHYKYSF